MEPNIVFGLCLGCFIVGLALGYLLFRGDSSSATQEAEQARTELADYRGAVNEHFSETAEHFKALGQNYRDLYQHMARGSEALMGDGAAKVPFVPMEQLLAAGDDNAKDDTIVAEQAPDETAAQADDNVTSQDDGDASEPTLTADNDTADGSSNDATSDAFAEERVSEPGAADSDESHAPERRSA